MSTGKRNGVMAILFTVAGALVIGLLCGGVALFKNFIRYQDIQDANNTAHVARIVADNEARVNELRIKAQEQRVQITKQDAEIRRQEAEGIRDAQDTIAKTITPLYVQLEMVRTLQSIAHDGKNNTVIYIPVGPDGLPVVAGAGVGR